jgi:hypothetical protein
MDRTPNALVDSGLKMVVVIALFRDCGPQTPGKFPSNQRTFVTIDELGGCWEFVGGGVMWQCDL